MSWELIYPLGALALLGLLVWGIVRVATRNRTNDPVTERATREEYDHPADYQRTQKQFQNQTRP